MPPRASELISLKVGDVGSQRMTLRVEQDKGRKDRYAILRPVLLQRPRVGWRAGHAQGKPRNMSTLAIAVYCYVRYRTR